MLNASQIEAKAEEMSTGADTEHGWKRSDIESGIWLAQIGLQEGCEALQRAFSEWCDGEYSRALRMVRDCMTHHPETLPLAYPVWAQLTEGTVDGVGAAA